MAFKELVLQKTSVQFKQYPNTGILIDCIEVFIQRPSSLQSQALTFSNYKNHNTFKVLIGISPGGVIAFVLDLWGGRVSDQEITEKGGLLDLLEPGDNVMADKGFDIQDILAPIGVRLNIPPFLAKKQQLTAREVGKTRRIAALHIHVERAIGRIKSYFKDLCVARFIHALESGNCTSRGIGIDVICQMVTKRFNPI